MTYIEWRDELERYLVALPKDEKEKMLSYFSEMYADKRDAGLSEREIIAEFGAPYDVAQRALNENRYDDADIVIDEEELSKAEKKKRERRERKRRLKNHKNEPFNEKPRAKREVSGLGVLLIILLAIPLFVLFIVVGAVSFALVVAPIGVIIGGFCDIAAAIGAMVAGSATAGIADLGFGIITVGAGFIILPLFVWIVKLIWKIIKAVGNAVLYKAV